MKKLLLIALGAMLAGSAAQAQMNNADLKWGAAPPGLPAGAQLASRHRPVAIPYEDSS